MQFITCRIDHTAIGQYEWANHSVSTDQRRFGVETHAANVRKP